ncbi:hypothetical protein P12x_004301 [Tundrisphaera lichenicola]|uniref:hypothetical protein n=1 Tax=Tundrisphaera lichenicola TaxID=2029860 RepID=UPI003EB9BD52
MSPDSDQTSPGINPRPGVVKTLGITNIVLAVLTLVGVITEAMWLYVAIYSGVAEIPPGTDSAVNSVGITMIGMNNLNFIRFCAVDAMTALILNLAMLISGIGLINLRGWGSRLWSWTGWIKIVRLFLLWGFYLVVISPELSSDMAQSVVQLVRAGGGPPGRGPSIGDLTRAYSFMNLIVSVSIIVLGSIYPAFSLWVLSRPGMKAALVRDPSKEPARS